jgi:hypothetical protein
VVAVRIDQSDGDDDHVVAADIPDGTDGTNGAGAPGPSDGSTVSDANSERQPQVVQVLEHRAIVDARYRADAIDQAYEKVRDVERDTATPAMKRIEAEDPERHLAGLENSLKGKDRLAEKANFDVQKKGVSVDQAIANVKDAIRYTFCYYEDAYTEGVYADCDRLTDTGFELVERRNSWDKEQYKGINSRWRVPGDGQLFELQFHTQASLDAKEETHWAYEKLRAGVPAPTEQRELEDYQKRITARVPVPPGAQDIPDYP